MSPEQMPERPPAPAIREKDALERFPFETISPEEYAARNGFYWICFSFHDYRYQDQNLDTWIQRLGEIFFTPGLLKKYRDEFLTPEELAEGLQREQEDF